MSRGDEKMNFINILRFSFRGLLRKRWKNLMIILLLAVGLMLIGTSILPQYLTDQSYEQCDANFKAGIENTGYIRLLGRPEGKDDWKDFFNEVYDLPEVDCVGSTNMNSSGIPLYRELIPLQEEHMEKSDADIGKFSVVDIDDSLLEIMDLDLLKGELVHNNEEAADDTIHYSYLYLGYGFKDSSLKVGEVYEISDIYRVKVAGIISEGSHWPTNEIYNTLNTTNDLQLLDYTAILVSSSASGVSGSPALFSVKEGTNIETTVRTIYDIAADRNLTVNAGALNSAFEERNKNTEMFNFCLFQIVLMIFVVIVVIQSCVQCVDIMNQYKNYGTYYSNGATRRDINAIIITEYIIRTLIATLLSIGIERIYLSIQYKNQITVLNDVWQLYFEHGLAAEVLTGIVIMILSLVVPIIMINRKTPVDLLKG